MERNRCITCGVRILKSALCDPYMCRNCERLLENDNGYSKYDYLDNWV